MGNSADTVKKYKTSEKKWKKDLKYIKKQNKIICSISKKSGSRREIKDINNIQEKYSKKGHQSSSSSSSDNSYPDSLLAIDSI